MPGRPSWAKREDGGLAFNIIFICIGLQQAAEPQSYKALKPWGLLASLITDLSFNHVWFRTARASWKFASHEALLINERSVNISGNFTSLSLLIRNFFSAVLPSMRRLPVAARRACGECLPHPTRVLVQHTLIPVQHRQSCRAAKQRMVDEAPRAEPTEEPEVGGAVGGIVSGTVRWLLAQPAHDRHVA